MKVLGSEEEFWRHQSVLHFFDDLALRAGAAEEVREGGGGDTLRCPEAGCRGAEGGEDLCELVAHLGTVHGVAKRLYAVAQVRWFFLKAM